MKAIPTRRICGLVIFSVVTISGSFPAFTQSLAPAPTAPLFRFQSPVLVSGTDKQVNAIYRFPLVTPGKDALVEIKAISAGMSLKNIDRTADGYNEAFQPEYKISGNTINGYIDFKITFVTTNTNTVIAQPLVDATGLDIDGDRQGALILNEMNRMDMGVGSTYSFNTTQTDLVLSQLGTAITGRNITGVLFGALVDTSAKQVMFTVSGTNVSSFMYRIGATTLMNGSSTRYASLYFKKFFYPPYPLALPKLINFDGNSNNKNVVLNWSFSSTEELDECILERGNTSGSYQAVASFLYTEEGENSKKITYTDFPSGSGNYFYRLKMKAKTGEIKYSNILAFKTGLDINTQSMVVYPSLVTDHFTIRLNAVRNETAQMQIVDYAGRPVYNKAVTLKQGENNVSVNDFAGYRGGFVVVLRTADQQFTQKIIAQ